MILNAATRRMTDVAPFRPMLRPLAVALLAGTLGWMLCTRGPSGLLTVAASGALTFGLISIGLWLVCRYDLTDTIRLGTGAICSAAPRLRRASAESA